MNTDVQAAEAGSAPQDRPTAQPESGPRISYVYAISRAGTALDAARGLTGPAAVPCGPSPPAGWRPWCPASRPTPTARRA